MQKRLIIWDFDGVIANTEKLWLKNRMETINKYFAKNWDYETTYKYLAGMSDKTKKMSSIKWASLQMTNSGWRIMI